MEGLEIFIWNGKGILSWAKTAIDACNTLHMHAIYFFPYKYLVHLKAVYMAEKLGMDVSKK